MMTRTLVFLFFFSGVILCDAQSKSGSAKPKNTQDLIGQMYERYKGLWYQTLTFTQQTEFFKDDVKEKEEIWYEAMDMKSGTLVIKFNSMNSGDGLIFRNDSILSYSNDVLAVKRPKVHELIVLGFTVYSDSPDKTLEKVKTASFNTDFFSERQYNNKSHYVVGDAADAQFWIDAETLLFTKLTRKLKDGRTTEVEFKGYQKLGKGWIETEVTFMTDGKLTMREVYTNIKAPEKLAASFHNQAIFSRISW